jgi:hypothetical protein
MLKIKVHMIVQGMFILLAMLCSSCGKSHNENINTEKQVLLISDSNGCLQSDNSEAIIDYTNGDNRSKTLIWNCGNYGAYSRKRVELLAISNDGGQCFRAPAMEAVSEGICESPASSPENITFGVTITDFQVIASGVTNVNFKGTFANTGNVDLLGLVYEISPGVTPGGSGMWFSLPVGTTYVTSGGGYGMSPRIPAGTYLATLNLKMWDGTIISTQTKTYTIND